jgi:hypothetical protein
MRLFVNSAVLTCLIILSTPLASLSSETFHFTAVAAGRDITNSTALLFIIDSQVVWPQRIDKKVIVPPELEKNEKIGVRILYNGQIVDFGEVYATKLQTDWRLEVLPISKSPASEHTSIKCGGKVVRYRVQFIPLKNDGTEMWKDVCVK